MTKITAIKATPINVPLDAPYVWSFGLFPGFTQSIIEIETSDGVTGIGEAPGAAAAARIQAGFADPLIGRADVLGQLPRRQRRVLLEQAHDFPIDLVKFQSFSPDRP